MSSHCAHFLLSDLQKDQMLQSTYQTDLSLTGKPCGRRPFVRRSKVYSVSYYNCNYLLPGTPEEHMLLCFSNMCGTLKSNKSFQILFSSLEKVRCECSSVVFYVVLVRDVGAKTTTTSRMCGLILLVTIFRTRKQQQVRGCVFYDPTPPINT